MRLTPEEWVRQHILHFLVEESGYPQSRIAVEHPIQVGQTKKRCDAVVMGNSLEPLCIIEFKAEKVALTQRVFDQTAVYNRKLQVPYLLISNGKTTCFCKVSDTGYEFLEHIPSYDQLTV